MVKLSNESESATNIELEESAALWAVTADSGPAPQHAARRRSAADAAPPRRAPPGDRAASHFLRAYDRLPGQAGLIGVGPDPGTVFAYGAATARTARALRGFFHPAAGRRLLWHVEERDRTRKLTDHIDDPRPAAWWTTPSTASRSGSRPVWPALRAQVVHGDITLDNLLIDDGDVTGVLDLGDLTHSTLVFDIAAAFGSLAATLQGDDLLPHPAAGSSTATAR